MTKKQQNIVEDVKDRLREVLEDLDRLLRPEQRKPARVPVPVRIRPERDPYDPRNR